MFDFLAPFKPYLYGVVFLMIVSTGGYIKYLQSDLADEKKLRIDTKTELDEEKKNNELIIQSYEKTLAIEKEIATQKAVTQEQKQEVIKTTSKVKEAVIKRGEIKQDEKSNFTIVTF